MDFRLASPHSKSSGKEPYCGPEHKAFKSFLTDLEVLGLRVSTRAAKTKQFAVFGARSNARWWLVPLQNRPAGVKALDMLQPTTAAAQLAKWGARACVRFLPHGLLGARTISLAGEPDLGADFDGRATDFAFFTGTFGPHRKTAIQMMDCDGRILGYAKLTRNNRVADFVTKEGEVLKDLGELRLKTAQVPKVLVSRSSQMHSLLVTDAAQQPISNSGISIGAKHLAFLREMHARSGMVGAQAVLSRMINDFAGFQLLLRTEWQARFARGFELLRAKASDMSVAFAHGDFTPWNCRELEDRLYVFDWEYSNRRYPIGYDHLHFLLSTLKQAKTRDLLERCEREIATTWFGGEVVAARSAMLFSLLIHAAFYFQRSHDAGDQYLDFEGEQSRGELIDYLLQGLAK